MDASRRIPLSGHGINDHLSYSYDAAHRPMSKIDQSSSSLGYNFDMANRVTGRSYPNSQGK